MVCKEIIMTVMVINNGVFTLFRDAAVSTWTASGTKSLAANSVVTYLLD